MSFFGLGGFEVLVIGAIALFVLGPKRLLEGIREGRKIYTDLKRQRVALQQPRTRRLGAGVAAGVSVCLRVLQRCCCWGGGSCGRICDSWRWF